MKATDTGYSPVDRPKEKRQYTPPQGCKMPPILLNPELRKQRGLIFGYGRGSDDRQTNTPIVQEGIVEQMASTLQGTWAGFFCDEDTSGRWVPFAARNAALCLIQHLRQGDKLVVTKVDRIGRTVLDGVRVFKWIHDNGVDLHIANFGGQRLDLTTANGALMANILLAFAQFESDLRRERILDTIAALKKSGKRYHSQEIYGWRRVPRESSAAKKYKIEPGRSRTVLIPALKEREQIRQMFLWHDNDGLTYQLIARIVGLRQWRRANGKLWVKSKKSRNHLEENRFGIARIWDAITYYRAMLIKHGKEKWDDYTLSGEFRKIGVRTPKVRPQSSSEAPDVAVRELQAEPDDEELSRLPPLT